MIRLLSLNKWYLFFGIIEMFILTYSLLFFSDYIIFFPLFVIASVVFFYALTNEEFWILSSIVLYAPLFILKSEKITVIEMGLACYLFIPIGIWFIRNLLIEKNRIFESVGDYLVLVFYLMSVFSVTLIILNNFSPLMWFKEIIVLTTYLFYFPIKKYFKEKRINIYRGLSAFGILVFFVAISNLYSYRSKMALATQFFQIWGSRIGATEQLFLAVIILIISTLFLIKNHKILMSMILLLGISSIALILSFTRSYIGYTVFSVFIIWFFFNKRDKIKFSIWIFLLSGISLFLMLLIFSNLTKFIFEAVLNRFLEAQGRDTSLIQRVIETQAILEQIVKSPIIGWGIGSAFRRYDLYYECHINYPFAHNAYLYLWFKLGIIGLLVYMYLYIEKIIFALRWMKRTYDPIMKNLLLASIVILTGFIIISITSPQFYHRPSILIITLLWSLINSCRPEKKPAEIRLAF